MNVSQPAASQPPHSVVEVRGMPAAFHDQKYQDFAKATIDKFTSRLTYLCGDRVMAREAALDGLIELAKPKHWSQVRAGAVRDVDRYAFKLAFNKMRNARRSHLRQTAHEVELTDEHADQLRATSPLELPEWRTEFHNRLELLELVMPRFFQERRTQAETVYLRYLQEYEVAEVASTLGTKVATVRSNLRHGLAYLRREIQALEAAAGPGDEGGRI